MREILFRGKDSTGIMNHSWFYGSLDTSFNVDFPRIIYKDKWGNTMLITVDVETIGQYTGLTDKNGTKIFEGDILVFCKGATHSIKVYWDCLGWKFLRNGKRIDGAFECDIASHIRQCEVIGNIYDNSELLTHQHEDKGEY